MKGSWQHHRFRNGIQTAFLILTLLAILTLAGQLLFGTTGLWITLAAGLLALLIEPAATARLTLSLYRAHPMTPAEAPQLYAVVQELARRAELPSCPRLYHVPSRIVNAFAVGSRQHAAIALTDGLLHRLERRELTAVLAHEMAHIAHGDLRVMGLADAVSRFTGLLSSIGQIMLLLSLPWALTGFLQVNWSAFLLLIMAPHLALLAQLGLSRVREYDADLRAAELTGDPVGLAVALQHLEQINYSWKRWLLPGWGNPEPSWLRTHPTTAERIRRLQALSPAPERWLEQPTPRYRHGQRRVERSPRWFPGDFWH